MVCTRPQSFFVCILKSETKGFSFINIATQIIILACIVFFPKMKHLGLGVWHHVKTHTYCLQSPEMNCQQQHKKK